MHADLLPGVVARRLLRLVPRLPRPDGRLSRARGRRRAAHRRARAAARGPRRPRHLRERRRPRSSFAAVARVGVRTAAGEVAAARGGARRRRTPSRSTSTCSPREHVPGRVLRAIERFELRPGHVQGRLDARRADPVAAPERARARRRPRRRVRRRAERDASELARGLTPPTPFLVMGQYSMADPTRMPRGQGGRLGVHASAAAAPIPATSPERMEAQCRGARARLPRADPRAARLDAGRARGCRRNLAAARSAAAPRSSTSSSSSGRSPGSAGPRRRSTGSTSAPRPRTPAAACTAGPGAIAARAALRKLRLSR